jgi:predicted phage terminase large subunit-like protein
MTVRPDARQFRAACREQVYAAARNDFYLFLVLAFQAINPGKQFIHAKHLEALAWQAERLIAGDCLRLLVAIAPRFFKSFVFSIALPAYVLGREPGLRVACASYGDALSSQFEFDFRKLTQSEEYRRIFPHIKFVGGTAAQGTLATSEGGYRLSTSVGGPLTGKGCDYLIVDDPLKADEAESEKYREHVARWFKETAMTRLDDRKKGRVAVISQRLHEDDLVGQLSTAGGFELLSLPALTSVPLRLPLGRDRFWELETGQLLFPERVGAAELEQLRKELSETAFQAQIMQNPVPRGGTIIKMESFARRYSACTMPTKLSKLELVVQSWDVALTEKQTSDYSVCTTWGIYGDQFYLLDVLRDRLSFPKLRHAVLREREKHNAAAVIVERSPASLPLLQELRSNDGANWLRSYSPTVDKVARCARHLVKIEQGRVRLPDSAPWLAPFEHELRSFPLGRYDDQVDSMTQMFEAFDVGRNDPLFSALRIWRDKQPVVNVSIVGRRR